MINIFHFEIFLSWNKRKVTFYYTIFQLLCECKILKWIWWFAFSATHQWCNDMSLVYFRWQDICEIYVSGGNLDHMSDLDILRERGGAELRIVLLNSTGKVRCQGQRRQKFQQSKKTFFKIQMSWSYIFLVQLYVIC